MSSETQMVSLRLKWHFQKCHLKLKWWTWDLNDISKMSSEPQMVDLRHNLKNLVIWASESLHMAVRSLPRTGHLSPRTSHMALRSPVEICHLSWGIWQMSLRYLKKLVIWVWKTVIWELGSDIFITLEALKIFTLCHMCEYVFVCVCILFLH